MDNSINAHTLLNYMPPYYKSSKIIENFNKVNAEQVNLLNKRIEKVFNQFFIVTLDEAIERKEKEFGIKIDRSMTLQERVNRLLPKNRGIGTSTKAMLESVAKSFVEKAELIEDNQHYAFTLNLLSEHGFPYKLDFLYDSIEELKPAHLNVSYLITSQTKEKINIGTVTLCGETITVYPYQTKDIESNVKVEVGGALDTQYEIVTVYPKEV